MLRNENHGITDTDHEIVKQAVLSSVSSTSGYFSYSSDDPLRNKLSYNLQFLLSLKWSSWLHTGKLKRQASIVWTLLEYRQSSVLCALLWGDRSGPWSLTWLSACIIHNKVNRKLYTLQAGESSICLFVCFPFRAFVWGFEIHKFNKDTEFSWPLKERTTSLYHEHQRHHESYYK